MLDATLQTLADFPRQLAAHYAAVPADHVRWMPAAWDGIPSEHFTAIEQVFHVRDIEVQGYHIRFRRTLDEDRPILADIDSYALAAENGYRNDDDAQQALHDFSQARADTIKLLSSLKPADFDRPAIFAGYGPVTVRGLMHYLCSHDQQHLAGLQWLLGQIEAARMPTTS